jgi:hypothetical protein
MSLAALDRLLAALIVGLAATGLVSLVSGDPTNGWLFILHDVLAGFLAVAVVAKLMRAVPKAVHARRWGPLTVAGLVMVAAGTSIAAGFVSVAGGSIVWVDLGFVRWSLLTLHAVAGVALVPLVLVHLAPRRWRVLRVHALRRARAPSPDPIARRRNGNSSRRAFLAAGGYAAIAMILVGTATTLDTLRGGVRRFTGSRFLPEGPPGVPTTFLGEPPPAVDMNAWRLRIVGRVERETALDIEALMALAHHDLRAVLDCTSGWAVEATWTGAALGDVLALAGAAGDAARVDVVSVTGWRTSVRRGEANALLLAWTEGGRPITTDHGAPLRLVAPDHRGLEWVKWIERIEVS